MKLLQTCCYKNRLSGITNLRLQSHKIKKNNCYNKSCAMILGKNDNVWHFSGTVFWRKLYHRKVMYLHAEDAWIGIFFCPPETIINAASPADCWIIQIRDQTLCFHPCCGCRQTAENTVFLSGTELRPSSTNRLPSFIYFPHFFHPHISHLNTSVTWSFFWVFSSKWN